MVITITSVRIEAASNPNWKRGVRPSEFNVIARDLNGDDWKHELVFNDGDVRMYRLTDAVDAKGTINIDHWKRKGSKHS